MFTVTILDIVVNEIHIRSNYKNLNWNEILDINETDNNSAIQQVSTSQTITIATFQQKGKKKTAGIL